MRSRNSRPHDDTESQWLADVHHVFCVFCNDATGGPVEAHHPTGCQGLHFLTCAACKRCHDGHVWRIGGITEVEAANETVRRVLLLRAGTPYIPQPSEPLRRSRERKRGSDKIVPRKI